MNYYYHQPDNKVSRYTLVLYLISITYNHHNIFAMVEIVAFDTLSIKIYILYYKYN